MDMVRIRTRGFFFSTEWEKTAYLKLRVFNTWEDDAENNGEKNIELQY